MLLFGFNNGIQFLYVAYRFDESWVEGQFCAFLMLASESDFHNATTWFFTPKLMTMAPARVIRGEYLPDGGVQSHLR
jgi:hypothetical protein